MSNIGQWKKAPLAPEPQTPATPRSIIAVKVPRNIPTTHKEDTKGKKKRKTRQIGETSALTDLLPLNRGFVPSINDFATAAGQQIPTPFELINYENLAMLNGFGTVINESTYTEIDEPGSIGKPLIPNNFLIQLAPASGHPNREYLRSPRFKGENKGYALSCNAATGRTLHLVVGQAVSINWRPGRQRMGDIEEQGSLILTSNAIGGPPNNVVNSVLNNPTESVLTPTIAAVPFYGTRAITPRENYVLNVNEAMAYAPLYIVETAASFSTLRVVVYPRPPATLSRVALRELEELDEEEEV